MKTQESWLNWSPFMAVMLQPPRTFWRGLTKYVAELSTWVPTHSFNHGLPFLPWSRVASRALILHTLGSSSELCELPLQWHLRCIRSGSKILYHGPETRHLLALHEAVRIMYKARCQSSGRVRSDVGRMLNWCTTGI